MFNAIRKFFVKLRQSKLNKIKEKQHAEFKKAMNEVYRTLKWVEKQMPNRKSRRQFYSDVLHTGFIHSDYMRMFLDPFVNRDEVVLDKAEYNVIREKAGLQPVK